MTRYSRHAKLRRVLLTTVLIATALLVFAAPARAWVNLDGYGCRIRSGTVHAWISVSSSASGTGYVNIYKRSSSGNLLVARSTASGKDLFLHAYEPYSSGRSYFATMGFNGPQGSASAGIDCKIY
jgi:hypothetical protein